MKIKASHFDTCFAAWHLHPAAITEVGRRVCAATLPVPDLVDENNGSLYHIMIKVHERASLSLCKACP